MDSGDPARMLFAKILSLEPDYGSKINGYLLLQDLGESELLRLAHGPESVLKSFIMKVKSQLGISSNNLSSPSSTLTSPFPLNPTCRPPINGRFGSNSNGSMDFSRYSSSYPSSSSTTPWSLNNIVNPSNGNNPHISPKHTPILKQDNGVSVMDSGADAGGSADLLDDQFLRDLPSFLDDSCFSGETEDVVDPRIPLDYSVDNGETHLHRRSFSADASLGSEEFLGRNNNDIVSAVARKKSKSCGQSMEVPCCQIDGCDLDLSSAKDYLRKHRVCEKHSKSPKVTVSGLERRFCQQCSRFHAVSEFDENKRSCRKGLSHHNARRRKPQGVYSVNPERVYDQRQHTNMLDTRSEGKYEWGTTYDTKPTQRERGFTLSFQRGNGSQEQLVAPDFVQLPNSITTPNHHRSFSVGSPGYFSSGSNQNPDYQFEHTGVDALEDDHASELYPYSVINRMSAINNYSNGAEEGTDKSEMRRRQMEQAIEFERRHISNLQLPNSITPNHHRNFSVGSPGYFSSASNQSHDYQFAHTHADALEVDDASELHPYPVINRMSVNNNYSNGVEEGTDTGSPLELALPSNLFPSASSTNDHKTDSAKTNTKVGASSTNGNDHKPSATTNNFMQ